ncbi:MULTISPECIES: phosphoenolpyruvate carboxykinase (ATP) [Croceibacter]|jgi:phosphoenolpyruvate carboxykinase (ATP)|uniref:phosphoenolpyruvate carboxykinase (ATP) n=1 Tax=Croceibacter TaxID=216431 RepID=UPI000C3556E2|nr:MULTISPECIES: phosphoenolpyruvate carboxykinase (ATP) [Croceibacter]MAM22851.1 phosphoenolpyruvate carboxykinase (ATP) [Croceibacter sp.]MBG25869.1 phosphoenolpyruvate carboxykinase (ATP) [Croceibacter sp.]WSP35092.1 phosphoenolpyruvate carboxykinase (ATP) [Croceibacter atlanticus]HAT69016.1 phosphoenolpyruvate carboxykinase (ATP) [Flavobacteriaceae bacterium]|tara:strand:- start:3802 stop:5412 length:1611 start_codon:yes stop_codon:yes gene_type:complete
MVTNTNTTKSISLEPYGIKDTTTHYQLTPSQLHETAIANGQGQEASSGALAINTGEFTGRSPLDRFIVKDDVTKDEIWWGNINIPFDADKFDALYDKVTDYLSGKEVFVRDSYACADEKYKLNIRVVNEYPWSNMFAYNMFLRPSEDELKNFKEEWLIVNAPGFMADPEVDGTRQHNFAILNFGKKIALIGGTGYTGEIKKGIFSALNFILPVQKETLPMHCSANVGEDGDTSIFFGLSGTGKTTLSADPNRKLIGDDEHGWTKEDTIFNFEGGCYAKVINLSKENEPDIYNAIKPGAILENVVLDENGDVDFADTSITQNTRVSYPIYHIDNIQEPSIGKNPKNIFFLTADAFGVLPPISKLSPGQAAYHFISGYTAKVAGTEAGVDEPMPSFSACFGAPFMPLHPTRYAEMLSQKMKDSGVNVWLVNTGWTGGPYGVGKRMALKYTRAMISAAMDGSLEEANKDNYHTHSVFGVKQPRTCPNVPTDVLSPRKTWNNDEGYYKKAYTLAESFRQNFLKFEEYANEEILAGAPNVK